MASRIAACDLHRRPPHRARRLTAASQQEPQPGTPEKLRKELLEKLEKWASSCGGAPKLRGKAQLGGRHLQEGQVDGLHDLWRHRRARGRGEDRKHAARPARTTGPRSSWFRSSASRWPRAWLVTLLKERRPKTSMTLWRRPESIMIVTDASPQGCGGLLLVRATFHTCLARSTFLPIGCRDQRLGENHRGQGGQDGQPKKLQRSDFSLGLNRSHDASEAGATWAAHKPSAHIADHGAHTAPRGRGPARAHRALRPMAFCVRLRGLDSMHFPSRSIVDRCATCHSGASLSSAAVADGCSVLQIVQKETQTKPGTSRSSSRRSRTPARQQQCRSRPETREAPGRGLRQGHRERTEGAFPTGPPGFGTGPRPLRFFCCGSPGPSMGTGTREPPRQVDADRTVRRSFPRSGL